jgi:hypothetical protein
MVPTATANNSKPPRKEGTTASSCLATRRIAEAFVSLDSHGDNRLDHSDVQTLFLGLGYQPIDITMAELWQRRREICGSSAMSATKAANAVYHAVASTTEERWTLPQVIDVLTKVRRVLHLQIVQHVHSWCQWHSLVSQYLKYKLNLVASVVSHHNGPNRNGQIRVGRCL